MLSKEMEILKKNFKNTKEKLENRPFTLQGYRNFLDFLSTTIPVPRDIKRKKIEVNDVFARCFFIKNKDFNKDKLILHFHGGGYIAGSTDNSREFCGRISRYTNIRVLSVDYSLCPEKTIHSGLDDALKIYKWLIKKNNLKTQDIIFMGESAGGGLVLRLCLKLIDLGIQLPKALVLLSPWTDLALRGSTLETKKNEDYFLIASTLNDMMKLILSKYDNPEDPFISPLYGDLKGFPPMYVIAGTSEILLDDTLRLIDKAKSQGVEITYKIWNQQLHCFPLFGDQIPESKKATNDISNYIKKQFQISNKSN